MRRKSTIATAATALDLSVQNEGRIKKIQQMLIEQEKSIGNIKALLAARIKHKDNFNQKLAEATTKLFGYTPALQ